MTKPAYAWTVSGSTLTLYLDEPVCITSDHPNFQRILAALEAGTDALDLVDPDKALVAFAGGDARVLEHKFFTQRMIDAGYPRMAGVLQRCLQRPNNFVPALNWPLELDGTCDEAPYEDPEDQLVIERIQGARTSDGELLFDLGYRNLVFDEALFPIEGLGFVIAEDGRSISAEGVTIGIEYLRKFYKREEK